MRSISLFVHFLTTLACVILYGCAVGPDFLSPRKTPLAPEPIITLSEETVSYHVPGGEAQRFHQDRDIPAEWWTLFRSEPLDFLIREALSASPTIEAAEAALRQAAENRRARFGSLFPSLNADFSATRRKITGGTFGQPDYPGSIYSLHNASVQVSYTLDLFGGVRRSLEDLDAKIEFERFQLEAARLALAANIVTSAVREASVRERIQATREIIAADEKILDLVRKKSEIGSASLSDVLSQEAQLAVDRALLPALEKGLSETRHLLALLVGKRPDEADGLPEFTFSGLELPRDLPVSLSSELVRQRPDVRAAEEILRSANALVGVATADLFPNITLSGAYGSEATRLSDLFTAGTNVWNLGAGVLQPLFRGGELAARRRAAIAARDQAAAQYRETVLAAFQDVADCLRALEFDAKGLAARADAERTAGEALDLTRKRVEIGAADWISLLNAQRVHEQNRIALVEARAARLADSAALFQALGGGWWNRGSGGLGPEGDKNLSISGALRP